MTTKALIIDSGMQNLGGHNFSYTSAVQRALEARGCQVTVFTHKQLAPELVASSGYHPIFSNGAYDFPPGRGPWRDLSYLYAQARVYSEELTGAFKKFGANEFGLIFCHTVNDFELIGWKRFLSRQKIAGHLMILMRYTPGFATCSRIKLRAHPYWRIRPHYLEAIYGRMRGRFVLLTDSDLLTADYAHVFSHPIVTMPIPINEYFLNHRIADAAFIKRYGLERDGHLSVGFVGDSRPVKGFGMLPSLIEQTLSKTDLKVRFVIQCPAAASGYTDEQSAEVNALQAMAQRWTGRVKLISERLSELDYAALSRSLDIVLVPYSGTSLEATSGIFAEALALAKPVIVSSDTWMAHELRRSGGGVEFRRGDGADLAAKLVQAVHEFESLSECSRKFSEDWRAFHNSHNLADMLISEAGLDAAPRLYAQEKEMYG